MGADDGTVSLWDAESLDLLGTVVVPVREEAVAVAPIITTDGDVHDDVVRRARLSVGHQPRPRAYAFACQMAGRSLTSDEWERALPDLPYEQTCPAS
jgi:hypothetical protein